MIEHGNTAQSEDEARTDPHVCARCALTNPTCCRLDPGSEEYCFPVSEMEWERILEYAGEQGSFVQEPNSKPFVTNMKRLFPGEHKLVEQLFPLVKFHLRLATDKDGTCTFLRDGGCALPREARPYYCRLFPFWIYGERLTIFTPPHCLAVKEAKQLTGLMRTMDQTEASLRTLHGRLRLAWGLPPKEGMELLEQSFVRYKK